MSNVQAQTQKKGFSALLDSPTTKQRIEEVLGERKMQFITSALSLFNSNTQLQNCEPTSIFNACLTATSLGLPINNNLGFAYIIPYKTKIGNDFVDVAQFQIGYKGFRQLAINSNQYKNLEVKPIYEGQLVEDDSFGGFHFNWKEKKSEKVIGYASYFQLLNGFENTFYLSIEDIEKHAKKYSKNFAKYGTGLWKDDFDKMAKKTVVKLHLNSGFAPLSIEMQKAQETDQSVISETGYKFVDNEPIDLNELNASEEDKRTLDFLNKVQTLDDYIQLKDSVPQEVFTRLENHFINIENQLIINQQTK
jgi:recombination protein RecT